MTMHRFSRSQSMNSYSHRIYETLPYRHSLKPPMPMLKSQIMLFATKLSAETMKINFDWTNTQVRRRQSNCNDKSPNSVHTPTNFVRFINGFCVFVFLVVVFISIFNIEFRSINAGFAACD